MTRIQIDLYRLPYDLNHDAIERLQNYWGALNEATPMKVQARMNQHFGRSYVCLDALAGQTDDWRGFLQRVLADAGSYVDANH
jgi:hypothetical protein